MKQCPQCGSGNIYRSRIRNVKERILRFFLRRPYRCNNCGWRGIGKQSSSWMKHPAKYSRDQLILIVILATIFIITILWLISREPDKAEIPLKEGQLYKTSTFA